MSLISKEHRRSLQNVDMSTNGEILSRRMNDQRFKSLTSTFDEHEKRKMSSYANYNMLTNWRMKTDNENKEVVEKEKTRRSRKDKEGRDHICGCGKMYLSYPALYTHIKQKHNNKQPEGTKRMNANGPSRRGRPRRQRKEEPIYSIDENPAENEIPRVLKKQIEKTKLNIIEQYEDLVKGTIMPQSITFPKFTEQIEAIKKQHVKELNVEMSIDRVMAIYLFNMTDFVNHAFFEKLEEILVLLRDCVNRHYVRLQNEYQKITKIFTGPAAEIDNSRLCSEVHTCEYLPLISQFFILKYLPLASPKTDQKLAEIVLQDFCEWLHDNKLTHLRLTTYTVETIPNFSLGDLDLKMETMKLQK